MLSTHAVITVNLMHAGMSHDLEVPLDISAGELCSALFEMYMPDKRDGVAQHYLRAERPIALLRGERTLRDYGVRDGTQINMTR